MDFTKLKSIDNINWRGCKNFELKFFENDDQQHNSEKIICYGRNGSGKSSIGEALLKIKQAVLEEDFGEVSEITIKEKGEEAQYLQDYQNKSSLKNLHIFNEDFVKRNIEISEDDNLEAIIMFGSDIADNKRKEELQEFIDKSYQKYDDLSNSKELILERIESKINELELQYINPVRDRRNRRQFKHSRKDYTFKYQINDISAESEQINKDIKELDRLKALQTSDKMKLSIDNIPNYIFNDEIVLKELPEPNLSEREYRIVELIKTEKGLTNWYEKGMEYIEKTQSDCPLCFQTINNNLLLEKINEIINPSVKSFLSEISSELENIKMNVRKLDQIKSQLNNTKQYINLEPDLKGYVDESILEVNKVIKYYDELYLEVETRSNNVYSPSNEMYISNLLDKIHTHEKKAQACIHNVRDIEKIYNEKINEAKEDIQNLKLYIESKVFNLGANILLEDEIKQKAITDEIKNLKSTIKKSKDELKSIEQKLQNSTHALDLMKSDLSFIFFDENRLRLEIDEKNDYQYKILVHGRPVSAKKLSTGEKNALALVYFFKYLFNEQNIEDDITTPLMLVLDDPISSMDENNLIGLLSYINSEINSLLSSSPRSRVLIMTHRWYVFDSLFKLFGKDKKQLSFELTNDGEDISQTFFKWNKQKAEMGYKGLLNKLYEYGKATNPNDSSNIGNLARRVLEAYLTFNYKIGPSNISDNPEIFERIDTTQNHHFIENFKKRAFRLILNSDSHSRDEMYQLGTEFTDNNSSENEKQLMCQSILGFLYLIDDVHIKKHLGDNTQYNWDTIKSDIEQWIQIS